MSLRLERPILVGLEVEVEVDHSRVTLIRKSLGIYLGPPLDDRSLRVRTLNGQIREVPKFLYRLFPFLSFERLVRRVPCRVMGIQRDHRVTDRDRTFPIRCCLIMPRMVRLARRGDSIHWPIQPRSDLVLPTLYDPSLPIQWRIALRYSSTL